MSFIRRSLATSFSCSLGVSWVTSLESEAAMFSGLLNHVLTWNRPQRLIANQSCCFHFPHSYYRMPVHNSYESLETLQCLFINIRRRQRLWLDISGVSGRCMFDVLQITCQTSRFSTTVSLNCLLECLSHLASALQAAWLFFLGKVSGLSRERRLNRRTFPPVLGPAVPCGWWLGGAILFLQDITLFNLLCDLLK